MKDSEYTLATNLAKIRAAYGILREVFGLDERDEPIFRAAMLNLSSVTEHLENLVDERVEGDDE